MDPELALSDPAVQGATGEPRLSRSIVQVAPGGHDLKVFDQY
jgi:hypothetical protein